MGITSGRTKVENLALDLVAITSQEIGILGHLIEHADEDAKCDLLDDPLLVQIEAHLQRASELDPGTDMKASVLQALAVIKRVEKMDFSKIAGARIRAHLVPFKVRMEKLQNQAREIIGLIHSRGSSPRRKAAGR